MSFRSKIFPIYNAVDHSFCKHAFGHIMGISKLSGNRSINRKKYFFPGGNLFFKSMGRALMSQPKVLLLDEPSMGLSPIMVDKIFEVVRDVYALGVTILLVEQNASRALAIADRGYVMESGLITMAGPGQELLNDPKVRAAYLGE